MADLPAAHYDALRYSLDNPLVPNTVVARRFGISTSALYRIRQKHRAGEVRFGMDTPPPALLSSPPQPHRPPTDPLESRPTAPAPPPDAPRAAGVPLPSTNLRTLEDWQAAFADFLVKAGMLGQNQMPPLPGVEQPEAPRVKAAAPEILGSEQVETQGVYRVLVTPDPQLPYEDPAAMDAVEQFAADHEWDEWIDLGDFLDLDFLSKYNELNARANANKKLGEVYHYGREVIDRRLKILRRNNPQAKMTMLEGNHDFRVENAIDRTPHLEGLIEVERGLELREKRVRWVRTWRDKSVYRVGKALFSHGLYHGMNHARKMVENFGDNIFYGHTHDVMLHPKVLRGKDKTIVGQSMGCLCRYDQSYIQGAPTNWQQALGIFYFLPDGHFTYYVPRLFGGRFVAPDGKVYQGRG